MTREPSPEDLPSVSDVRHAWLRDRLGWRLEGDEPIEVRSLSRSGGLMGTVHRITAGGRSVVLKGSPASTTGWGGLAVDAGLMRREVEAYAFLRSRGPGAVKVSPDCLWSALRPDGRGALALEDLGPSAVAAQAMTRGLTRAQARAAVRCLAHVHQATATTSGDPLSAPQPWPLSAASPDLVAAVRMGVEELPRLTAHWPEPLDTRTLDGILGLDLEAALLASHHGSAALALCHGDAWAANVLFATGMQDRPVALLIDWQFAMWGNPLTDLALLLMSSLDPADRRSWTAELIRDYHSVLAVGTGASATGAEFHYTLRRCRADLRRALPFAGLVALATAEAYAAGLTRRGVRDLAPRLHDAAALALRALDHD